MRARFGAWGAAPGGDPEPGPAWCPCERFLLLSLCRVVSWRGRGRLVYAAFDVPDPVYRGLRGRVAVFGNLVRPDRAERKRMKATAFAMTRRAAVLAGILLALVLVWAVFYRQIHGSLAVCLLLNSA